MLRSRSKLAIAISKVEVFTNPKVMLEQYPTPSEIAADLLWQMYMREEISGKIIADLGCGTGILGIGALLLGAKKVYFVDQDADAIDQAKTEASRLGLKGEFILSAVEDFNHNADAVIMNPPFGIKKKHADRAFLLKAMEASPLIYSYHKSESEEFIKKLTLDNGFRVEAIIRYDWPIKAIYGFHKKNVEKVDVGCFEIRKK